MRNIIVLIHISKGAGAYMDIAYEIKDINDFMVGDEKDEAELEEVYYKLWEDDRL
jgi:hypothetical protein